MKRWLVGLAFFPLLLFGQSEEQQLADQYFAKGEFAEAIELYEKLYDQQLQRYFLDRLIDCYLGLDRLNDAEKLAEKHLRKSRENPSHALVQLGYIRQLQGEGEKAAKCYREAIGYLDENPSLIYQLAQSFNNRNLPQYTLEAYQRAETLNPSFNFHYAKALLYGELGRPEDVYREFFLLLERQPTMLHTVQNYLAQWISENPDDSGNVFVKQELLQRIQNNPDPALFEELLIWVFIQERNFNGAFAQLRALDKRGKDQQAAMYNLGTVCLNNSSWSTARRCFEYVAARGEQEPFYWEARNGLLQADRLMLEEKADATAEEWKTLTANYGTALHELGFRRENAAWVRELAHILGFRLNQTDSALSLLDLELTFPALPREEWAQVTIDYGDLLVYKEDYYSAILAYARVEKQLETEPLGQEAKYRRALVAYYQGDFEWAQALFDGLKNSTSKLIANDALRYSVLIKDNIGLDTSTEAMQVYARADLLFFQDRLEEAWITLDSVDHRFAGHSLADEVLYKRAEIRSRQDRFTEARDLWKELVRLYGSDILGDDALFHWAELEEKLNNPTQAQSCYEQLLLEHGDSMFAEEARKRFRRLRGDSSGT